MWLLCRSLFSKGIVLWCPLYHKPKTLIVAPSQDYLPFFCWLYYSDSLTSHYITTLNFPQISELVLENNFFHLLIYFSFRTKASHQAHVPKLGNGSRAAQKAKPEAAILTQATASASSVSPGLQWPRLALRVWTWGSGRRFGSVIPHCMVSRPAFPAVLDMLWTVQYHFDKFICCWN